MRSPEERREAQIASLNRMEDIRYENIQPDVVLDGLLAYFDEHEPAVADAIRYGVSLVSSVDIEIVHGGDDVPTARFHPNGEMVVNRPEPAKGQTDTDR